MSVFFYELSDAIEKNASLLEEEKIDNLENFGTKQLVKKTTLIVGYKVRYWLLITVRITHEIFFASL